MTAEQVHDWLMAAQSLIFAASRPVTHHGWKLIDAGYAVHATPWKSCLCSELGYAFYQQQCTAYAAHSMQQIHQRLKAVNIPKLTVNL